MTPSLVVKIQRLSPESNDRDGGRADVEDRPFAGRYVPIAASRKPTLGCGPPKRRERARKADHPSRLRKCVQR
jgi:hypothetical protein